MIHLSMNEITTYRWSLKEDVSNYESAGYDAIGVWLRKLIDYGEEAAVDLLAESDLHVNCVVWSGGYTGSDGAASGDSMEETIHALRLSAAIGAGCLVVYTGGRNNHIMKHAHRLLRVALDELVPLAEAVEVPLALEPMHPACAGNWTFLTSIEDALDVVREYDSPFLKLALDTYHFPLDVSDTGKLRELAPHLGIVHLGDRVDQHSLDQERCRFGSGCVANREIVRQLMAAGYEGDFDVKLVGPEIEFTDNWTLLEDSRGILSGLATAARVTN